MSGGDCHCASSFVNALGNRPPPLPHAWAIPALEGVAPEFFWQVAREAHVPLTTVFAIAGGHTDPSGGAMLLEKVLAAAKRVRGRS